MKNKSYNNIHIIIKTIKNKIKNKYNEIKHKKKRRKKFKILP